MVPAPDTPNTPSPPLQAPRRRGRGRSCRIPPGTARTRVTPGQLQVGSRGQEPSGEPLGPGVGTGGDAVALKHHLSLLIHLWLRTCIPSGDGWHIPRRWVAQPEPCHSLQFTPVPVPDPPAQHDPLDGYDDAMALPEGSPAPSAGDIAEGGMRRSWGCGSPAGKRGHGHPVPWRATLGGLWWWQRAANPRGGLCCRTLPGGTMAFAVP